MQQSQRPQHPLNRTPRPQAMRPVALCMLLLLSLLASLWQVGQHAPRHGLTTTSSATPSEERPGEKQLEEESPAKLRRVANLRAPRAAQPYPSQQRTTAVARILDAQIPAPPRQAHHALTSPRLQRGQAPPLA